MMRFLTRRQAHFPSELDAAQLTKMYGWNESERVNVQSVEVKVDASLMEQLRAGYTEMSAIRMIEPRILTAIAAASSEVNGPLSGPGPPPLPG